MTGHKYGPYGESIIGRRTGLYFFVRLLRRPTPGRNRARGYIKRREWVEVFKWSDPQSSPPVESLSGQVMRGRQCRKFRGPKRPWVSLGVFRTEEEALELLEQEVEIMKTVEKLREEAARPANGNDDSNCL